MLDVLAGVDTAAAAAPRTIDASGWWPARRLPRAMVTVKSPADESAAMLLQSVAGLAAKAVNEGAGDELVWVETGNVDIEDWFTRTRLRRPELKTRTAADAWELIDRYARTEIIKGYILYRADRSAGQLNEHRPGIDCSVNVATSLAGLLDGVIVEERLERQAQAHGLTLLADARDKTQAWCFRNHRDRFNRRLACTQDPRKPHARDLAIAQRAFTVYGDDEPTPELMRWLEPLSPVLGWNGGDERRTTEMSSRQGHLQTATDWCMNLPALMAGSVEIREPAKVKDFDPHTIDRNDHRSAVSFVSTDGDNVQFFEANFFRGSSGASYWGNPSRGKLPFGWSCCFSQLAQLCPPAIEYAAETQTANDGLVEWGGGYYYPDRFAADRPDRWDLLARQAARTWALMRRNNTRIIGFNVTAFDSPDARKAYEVIARQCDGLQGMLVFQYAPYEAGAGAVFWVKDAKGVDVPVVTARYSIWEHANRDRAGTPTKVARQIRRTVELSNDRPRYDWVIVHAWSWFKESTTDDETAEELPQDTAARNGGVRGYTPALWCAKRLPPDVRAVQPAELLWRLRMQHDPQQTTVAIDRWRP